MTTTGAGIYLWWPPQPQGTGRPPQHGSAAGAALSFLPGLREDSLETTSRKHLALAVNSLVLAVSWIPSSWVWLFWGRAWGLKGVMDFSILPSDTCFCFAMCVFSTSFTCFLPHPFFYFKEQYFLFLCSLKSKKKKNNSDELWARTLYFLPVWVLGFCQLFRVINWEL